MFTSIEWRKSRCKYYCGGNIVNWVDIVVLLNKYFVGKIFCSIFLGCRELSREEGPVKRKKVLEIFVIFLQVVGMKVIREWKP